VTNGDGAAVHIEFCLVDAELPHAGEHLGTERLVDLDAVDLCKLVPGCRKQRPNRGDGPDTHYVRRHTHRHRSHDAR
jgi:hypothetical protein